MCVVYWIGAVVYLQVAPPRSCGLLLQVADSGMMLCIGLYH